MFNQDRRLFDEGDRGVGKSYLIKRLAKVSTLNGIFLEAVVKVGLREVLGALPAIRERESIYLRELEFGLFDGIADEELSALFPLEYTHYNKLKQAGGEYYARMPCGESRCDVAQRVHQGFGSIHRDHENTGFVTRSW